MYYDDPYDPNEPNDYDEEEVASLSSSSHSETTAAAASVSSNKKKQRKLLEDSKRADKGYRKIKLASGKSVSFYCTNLFPGNKMRDVVTGFRDPNYKVGSRDEYLFFKVNAPSCLENKSELLGLFFDSPEQYEKIFQVTVPDAVKQSWHERFEQEKAWRSVEQEEKRREPVIIRG